MKIEILGTGCPKCKKLFDSAQKVASEIGLDYEIDKITDINQILSYGVMMTPGLVVNGKLKSVGTVPSETELKSYFQ